MNGFLDSDVRFLVEYANNIYQEISSLPITLRKYYPLSLYYYHYFYMLFCIFLF